MKIIYIANTRLPTEMAHGLQIMKMCEAFVKCRSGLTPIKTRINAEDQQESVQVELVVPWRFRISALGKKDPFEYYKVDKVFKIKKIFSFDLTPLNRFLGPVSSLTQALSFSLFSFFKIIFSKADIIYGRDRLDLFLLSFFKKNIIFEIHKIHKKLDTGIAKRVKKIIVITQGLKKLLIKKEIDKNKILIVPDGIDLDDFTKVEADLRRFLTDSRGFKEQVTEDDIKQECRKELNLPINKKIILYTGHLYKWKGVETLALSSKFLGKDTLIVIVGGIKWYLSNFRKFVEKNNLKNVLVLGYQDYSKIPYYLKAADCLILTGTEKSKTSKEYTSPMKMFEYMASKKPIIASDLPSFKEILNPSTGSGQVKQNAVLVEPDNPRTLAEGIKKVLNNPDLAERISKQAYKDVQRYSWNNRARKILTAISTP